MIDFEALFKVSYGLYLVSAGSKKKLNGFISNSVMQVTAQPPQFAVCCHKENYSAEIIKESGSYCISILKQDASKDVIGAFGYKSGRSTDKFINIHYKIGDTGIPIVLSDSIAYIECSLTQTIDVGTHLIFIGEALHAEILDDVSQPLTYAYYRNTRKATSPKNAPTYIDKKKTEGKHVKNIADKYQCPTCGYIFEKEKGGTISGIGPGTPFDDLPNNWTCPLCGTEKADFIKL